MELFTANYLAGKLGCKPSDVDDAADLLGIQPALTINRRRHYDDSQVGTIVCYLINSGRGSLDIEVPAETSETVNV